MTTKEIGERIRTMRVSRGMSQDQLAEAVGMSASAIAMYEAGRRRPKDNVVEALSDVFNVPKWSIIYHENEITAAMDGDDAKALWRKREALRRNPKRRMLFDLAERGTDRDVDAAVSLIDALRKSNPEFYDGDDPA